MKLKLKEGWLDYFGSGLCAGILIYLIIFLFFLVEARIIDPWVYLLLIFVSILSIALSIFFFISGSSVKKRRKK